MNKTAMFPLLRLGLRTSSDVQKESLSDLILASQDQWVELENQARFQGVSGIVLDGLQVIVNELGIGYFARSSNREFWHKFIVRWIGYVEQCYYGGNVQQFRVIGDVQRKWSEDGIRMMLMKGQAMGTYYPLPHHRCPGDIDCYLFGDYAKGNELAKAWADRVDDGWYKHSQIFMGGQMIENHQYFVHTREGKRSKELNRILVALLNVTGEELRMLPGTGALMPPPMFNALFLTYHALTHFLEEGLKLKQLLDWAMFLKEDADKVDWPEFYRLCDKFHMRRFADVASDIAVHYLGVTLTNPAICCKSPYTEKVLHSTLYDKDYVFSSGQGGWANRWHIVRNLFKYRWKYHQIYQHSVIRQLWWYVVGYLWKTE